MVDKLMQIPSDLWIGIVISIVGSFVTFLLTKIKPHDKDLLRQQLEKVYAPLYNTLKCDTVYNFPSSLSESFFMKRTTKPPFNYTYSELQNCCNKMSSLMQKNIFLFPEILLNNLKEFCQHAKIMSQEDITTKSSLFLTQYDTYVNLCYIVISNYNYAKNKLGYPKCSSNSLFAFKYYDFNTKKEIIKVMAMSFIAIILLVGPIVIIFTRIVFSEDSLLWLYRLLLWAFCFIIILLASLSRNVLKYKYGTKSDAIGLKVLLKELARSVQKKNIIQLIMDLRNKKIKRWY